MNRADMFPSKYLSASDLDDEGNTYTVETLYVDKMQDGTEKPILVLKGAPKDMVLNVTNWNTIANLHGDESDDWTGKPITVYPTETPMNGEMKPCIRVRGKKLKPSSPSKKPTTNGSAETAKVTAPSGPPADHDSSDPPF